MHLINASPLILPLAKREVDGREQGRYLLASFLVFSIPGYAGLLPSSGAGYSWALGFEAWFYIAIATFGVIAARDAAGGEKNKDFISEFTCLYVPVSITTLVPVWAAYWLLVWLLQDQLAQWSWSNAQFIQNLRGIGSDLFGLLTLVAHIVGNSVLYLRICKLLRKVQAAK
jgi:hypothetical protein